MEFSDFELSLIFILLETKIHDIRFNITNLDFNKDFISLTEYEKLKNENINALTCTEQLKNKIEKYLEE